MAMSKEEYLKRYLSGSDASEGKKKKKKKSKTTLKAKNFRIFDDDVDLKSMSASDPTKTLEDELPDEEPTVAEVVDERPEEIQRLESYRVSDKWKQLGADSKKKIRHDSSDSDGSPVRTVRHDSDSDVSPIREMRQRNDSDSGQSIPRKARVRHDSSDSDQSLPRKKSRRHDSESDSDESPPRRQRAQGRKSDSDNSPPRRRTNSATLQEKSTEKSKRYDSDSDQSPPRKNTKSRHDSDSDPSPLRRTRHDSDSDQSPPRKSRRKKSESDSDISPVRRKLKREDSDESPPRKRSRTRHDSDQSPPRRNKKRTGSDSDSSPPHRKRKGVSRWSRRTSESPERSSKRGKSRESDSEEDERDDQGRRKKTLGGVKAGLSTGRDVRKEMEAKKRKEEEMFSKLDADTLGKNAKTVFRDETGRRRNLKAEAAKDAEAARKKEEEQAALKAKYDRWGKGMAQQRTQERYVEDALHEVSKPLARFKDDEDLDEMLKNQEREDDPMLAYIKKKKSKTKGKTKEIPRYSGPQPPPNRYGIWPGYRWDGVDRSNGFEKKIFMDKANRKALENIKYKWSTEDM